MERSNKVPVVLRDEYTMYLELFDNLLWFHTDVHKWTAQVKRRFIGDMSTLVGLIGMPLVSLVEENNMKLMKFAQSIGMQVQQELIANSGEKAFIYSWR